LSVTEIIISKYGGQFYCVLSAEIGQFGSEYNLSVECSQNVESNEKGWNAEWENVE